MAEALLEFTYAVTGPDGRPYRARVCGRPTDGDRWEGWIEFEPSDGLGGAVLRTPRETVQPKRSDLEYWGTGLTPVYLEGALGRAIDSEHPRVLVYEPPAGPAFDGPAPPPRSVVVEAPATAVLDPFSVYTKGEHVLRQELSALAAWHLRNIIRAYALQEAGGTALEELTAPVLIEMIVAGVRRHLAAAGAAAAGSAEETVAAAVAEEL